MNEPIRMRPESTAPERGVSSWQFLKAFAFILIFFGPILPLTIGLWKWAIGG